MKRNRILYFSLFTLALLFIYFYGGKIPYMFFYAVVITPLISILLTTLAFLRFTYVEEIDKISIVKGEEFNYSLIIHNEDFFLYPYINVTFSAGNVFLGKQLEKESLSLPPFSKKTFQFKAVAKYRGEYEIGIKSIEFEDYLGIFKLTHRPKSPKVIKVYPRIVELSGVKLKPMLLSESHSIPTSLYENTNTISDIREYIYGDSIRRIHWKLSSKMNKLLVKKFDATSRANSAIILDLTKPGYSDEENLLIEDTIIECAVSFTYYLLGSRASVSLIYYKDSYTEIKAENILQFQNIYDILAKIKFNQDIETKDLLSVYVENNILKKSNILLFTSSVSSALFEELYKATLAGFDVSLIYVSNNNKNEPLDEEKTKMLKELPELGVAAYKISVEDNIKEVFCS
ncbi:DUF58 domain-containing protein [Acetivibrio saccincola]|jgi:uncharacterized protein (DUF58 family)|uniref:DUF58 domain-containing protein n=1 Tax=Acetivibrio saccincola TaxID=1677857 RepID=A0A2K9E0Y0_9FIRM|nr:DUF58 domain-containing protein [Acetivibrio saccincola]AUG57437.1 hypothetical protein HVS_07610 [Acetivibrio saccincola]NLW27496.1 DUF58 domain-containing protein [Acetivibrio saccincola]PQQ67361.1 DUF58 domain-containing protein [Acetivibrio saccincola]HOA97619.1 DUF58 domain-containing protein [Acetivibrio saccincola]HQD29746.1 DUF58 domain-containing protein [Acetivibrio saccincola]